MLDLAVLGAGRWGRILAHNFASVQRARLRTICDIDWDVLQAVRATIPFVDIAVDPRKVLASAGIGAVAIATPAGTHYDLARVALEAGKHVFVEKPLCLRSSQARELARLAELNSRVLMVGHMLRYHPGVIWMKEHMSELGRVHYLYSQRTTIAAGKTSEGAWWELAPHDVSVMLHLMAAMPEAVMGYGSCPSQPEGHCGVVFASLVFPGGTFAQIHVSCVEHQKIRKLTMVGENSTIVFDDMDVAGKIRIINRETGEESRQVCCDSPDGPLSEMRIPGSSATAPLFLECQHFVDCCLDGKRPLTDGQEGFEVVAVLEAVTQSLHAEGVPFRPEVFQA